MRYNIYILVAVWDVILLMVNRNGSGYG